MQPETFEVLASPSSCLTGAQVAALALLKEALETPHHVVVELNELCCGVARAEVVAPTAQHRIDAADHLPHVLHPVPATVGQHLHALSHPLHAARRRPALEVVAANAAL